MKNIGCIFTIFGGTGNLTYKKLMPAFYQLFVEGKIKNNISIIAIGRKDKTLKTYCDEIYKVVKEKNENFDGAVFKDFVTLIKYFKMDFQDKDSYKSLYTYMNEIDDKKNCCGNKIFYLATSPMDFPLISEQLKEKNILNTGGFCRAVFEKPFGYDLKSARKINDTISKIFGEDNIYRIDHYLGKEMIQNINMLRFSNKIFSTVWNNESIDNIQISVKESIGVEERGGYYDNSGALRDMVQNHLLQILSLVAMEPPISFDTNHVRDEKVKVIQNLKMNKYLPDGELVFGQYEGYKQTFKVSPDSVTETYVAMKCEVDSPRWKGVPFYLRTGKALNEHEAEVIIEFKLDNCYSEFIDINPNLLVIKIQPKEGVFFRINTKEPRTYKKLMTVSMDYCQSNNINYKSPQAYERLLFDIIHGDATLFTRWDEVDSAWALISDLTETTEEKKNYIKIYPVGSSGPKESHDLIEKDGRKWWSVDDLKITNEK